MSNIFISWSKSKSGAFASKLKSLIENLDPSLDVFMSEEGISAGEKFQEKIIQKIIDCDLLLLCLTKENKKSPWLLYEAGFASGLNKKVIPFLFDNDDDWHSWIDNPMNSIREININDVNFKTLFIECFGLHDSFYTRNALESFINDIKNIQDKYRQVDIQCESFVDKLLDDKCFKKESPIYRNKTAYFLTGFETFNLWSAIVESFLYTGKYLWIYGRKNMKLFSGNFKNLFEYLNEKASNENMSGIDFRCMFLNPDSEEVKVAHPQQDNFLSELKSTIKRAKYQIGDNDVLQKCFRMYSNKREEVIIRLDNTIIYSKPYFDEKGIPQMMTDTKFEVFSAMSENGKKCIEKYCTIWNNAVDLF